MPAVLHSGPDGPLQGMSLVQLRERASPRATGCRPSLGGTVSEPSSWRDKVPTFCSVTSFLPINQESSEDWQEKGRKKKPEETKRAPYSQHICECSFCLSNTTFRLFPRGLRRVDLVYTHVRIQSSTPAICGLHST